MTIYVTQHSDGDEILYVQKDDGKCLGICITKTYVNTDATIDLIKAVIAECGGKEPTVVNYTTE